MKVVKKDGRLQELDQSKIEVSILNATRDEKALLNESDAKIITEDVVNCIKEFRGEEDNTSSYEITGVVISILDRDGFDDVISSYIGYKK
ncbi:MAG: ATP cone domain-containing protein [Clostridium celatum]|nr:ATP cone domain-containing protein [Clostridium celatum]MDU4980690.1 ATP cone domain-containing protein [Clostridium celatum]